MDLRSEVDMTVLDNVEETGEFLGNGSYGEVKIVRYQGKEYAGKYFYPDLIHNQTAYRKCLNECKRSMEISHENIVQTIGVWTSEHTRNLVLVMEKMPFCLSRFVSVQERSLPDYINLCILHDVSKGLYYLHSNNIMHRDLTANNVLLTETLTAKISDFGQSKFVPRTIPNPGLTQAPGTPVYMPPEALDLSEYSFSIDTFSFGVLILHMYLHELPQPCDRFTRLPPPIGELLRQRPPLEYFDNDIQRAVPEGHLLHSLLHDCLQKLPNKRPSAENLVSRIKTLLNNEDSVFDKFVKAVRNYSKLERDMNELEQELRKTKEQLEMAKKDVELHGEENIKLNNALRKLKDMREYYLQNPNNYNLNSIAGRRVLSLDESTDDGYILVNDDNVGAVARQSTETFRNPLQDIDNIVRGSLLMSNQKAEKEEISRLWEDNQLLKTENEQLTATLRRLQREIDEEETRGRGRDTRAFSLSNMSMLSLQSIPVYDDPLPATVECDERDIRDFINNHKVLNIRGASKPSLPFSHVEGAKAVLIRGKVYMGRATNTILSYDRIIGKWDSLPPAPLKNYAIASYKSQLVLVGGTNNNTVSGDVYCYDEENRSWLNDIICPLKRARENAVAIGHLNYLIVLGGVGTKVRFFTNILKSIEVYCGRSREWYQGPNLPREGFVLQCISASNHLYILHPDGWTIRYCSLDQLVRGATSGGTHVVWQSINRSIPYTRCSIAVYNDTLLTLAGAGSDGNIYAYYPVDKKWWRVQCVRSLPAIKNASCLQLGTTKLFLCGGDIDMMNQTSQAGYLLTVEDTAGGNDQQQQQQSSDGTGNSLDSDSLSAAGTGLMMSM